MFDTSGRVMYGVRNLPRPKTLYEIYLTFTSHAKVTKAFPWFTCILEKYGSIENEAPCDRNHETSDLVLLVLL